MIKPTDGRTVLGNRRKRETRARIVAFFKSNPNATKTQAVNSLGISYNTLRFHLSEINKGK